MQENSFIILIGERSSFPSKMFKEEPAWLTSTPWIWLEIDFASSLKSGKPWLMLTAKLKPKTVLSSEFSLLPSLPSKLDKLKRLAMLNINKSSLSERRSLKSLIRKPQLPTWLISFPSLTTLNNSPRPSLKLANSSILWVLFSSERLRP